MDGGGGVPGQKSDRDFFGGMVKGNWDSVGDGATVGGGSGIQRPQERKSAQMVVWHRGGPAERRADGGGAGFVWGIGGSGDLGVKGS